MATFLLKKNRSKNKGGVATLIAEYLKNNTIKVEEGINDYEEFILTRLNHVSPPINILNIYGAQESRYCKFDMEKLIFNLQNIIDNIEDRGEHLLIIGDLNVKIGNDEFGILNNNSDIYEWCFLQKFNQIWEIFHC